MASYKHRIITTRRHEWGLKNAEHGGFGVPIAEVQKAIASAQNSYETIHGRPPNDNRWLCVWAADDEIVLWFDEEVRSGE